MTNRVDVRLNFGDDETIASKLAEFFAPIAPMHIWKEEEKATKSWEAVIAIVLTIVGEWATERYILDPLANKTEDWLKAISSTSKHSKSKRSYNIVVNFVHDTNTFEIEISGTSDHEILEQTWRYIRSALQIAQHARKQDIVLDRIRISPGSAQKPLVIGYEGNRPKYTINFEDASVHQIQSSAFKDEPLDAEVQVWLIEQLAKRLAYLRMLVDQGYKVSEQEIVQLEREIDEERAKLPR